MRRGGQHKLTQLFFNRVTRATQPYLVAHGLPLLCDVLLQGGRLLRDSSCQALQLLLARVGALLHQRLQLVREESALLVRGLDRVRHERLRRRTEHGYSENERVLR